VPPNDLHDKKRAYRRNGVQEYIVWQVLDRKIDWFSLQNGEYVSLPVDERGIVRSKVFPGLWLAVTALLSREIAQVLAVLQEGLSSPAHQRFVKQLPKQLL
jgi:Uma2 family endonuclease